MLFSKSAQAADDHIVINEVYPNPQGDESEWIELFNPTDTLVELSDFYIKDSLGNKFSDLTGKNIVSKGYLTIEDSNVLNNTGDSLFLKNNSGIIDQAIFGNWSSKQGKSFARYLNGSDTDNDSNDFITMAPTKGAENLKPQYSNDVIINEIVPTPDNGTENEFIELFNPTDMPIDLLNWQLDDGDGGSSPYTIPTGAISSACPLSNLPESTILGPKSYIVFYNCLTKIALNDSGDRARLIDPNGDVKNSISYSSGTKSGSYSRFENIWNWSFRLTPGTENIFEALVAQEAGADIVQSSILSARNQPNGVKVMVEGIVSAGPGIISTQYFYIQDESSGIQIYYSKKDFPSLRSGDKIRVLGETSEISGEKRIKINSASDISILSCEDPHLPDQTNISEVNEKNEGRYVKISGTVSRTSGNTFYVVDENNNEIKIVIQSQTKIKKPKMKKGDSVEISGIVSQYKDYYRVLPFRQEDVKILSSRTLPRAGFNDYFYLIISALILFIWNTFQKTRQRLSI